MGHGIDESHGQNYFNCSNYQLHYQLHVLLQLDYQLDNIQFLICNYFNNVVEVVVENLH